MSTAVTIEEAEHMLATRLWQNTAKVHFDVTQREDGQAADLWRACDQPGAGAVVQRAGQCADDRGAERGAHANPCFAGDTVRAWSEVLDKAETAAPGVGALRLRLVATRGQGGRACAGRTGNTCPRCCWIWTTGR